MSQSRTRFIGMDVPKATSAVAYGAHEQGAAVTALGTLGTRPCDSEHLVRTMPSTATHLLFGSEAGPCGDWLSRSLMHTGYDGGGVAPARLPPTPGDRVTTDRREARPLARLARSGDLPMVDVPTGAEAARRARPRAREDARCALQDAPLRLKAFGLRHALRAVALCGGVSAPGAAQRVSSRRPRGAGADRTPPASRPGTARARHSRACGPRERGPPGPAGGAVHGRGAPGSGNGRPDTV